MLGGDQMKNLIIEVLEEVGVFVENDNSDFSLEEYIENSVQFISFLATLEERLGIIFPIEQINLDNLKSVNAFSLIVEELKEKRKLIPNNVNMIC